MTFEIIFGGQVQGVGFRPFVFNLAQKFSLKGFVTNNEKGVWIEVSGGRDKVLKFYQDIVDNPPTVSKITHHFIREIPNKNFENFRILPSQKREKLNLSLTPDFGICKACKKEIIQLSNRRNHYPFTTCVNCGPRWAITQTFPFERENTSILDFEMCGNCQEEYTNPADRRFHSQTNTCATCGIEVRLLGPHKKRILNGGGLFKKAAELIKDGKILAIKNTSGYLLCCDANNKNTIEKLRERKRRPNKPFAILYPSLEEIEKDFNLRQIEKQELTSVQSPIVLLTRNGFKGTLCLDQIAPGLNQLGVMLPYSGILYLLSYHLQIPIVATSGNLHGSPIIKDNHMAFDLLKEVADFFIEHDLNIVNPQDDSVVKFTSEFQHKIIYRRSRGFAPSYFGNFSTQQKILALGAHLKSSISFLPNDHMYVSQYLGNLENAEVYERFIKTTEYFIKLFEQEPQTILTDAHPLYNSHIYAKELALEKGIRPILIQHHKAHFASVLDENNLFSSEERVLGVVWDGTGMGDDGNIWGGEFFLYQKKRMNRIAHFDYFDWIAADKMAKEPRISLLSLAHKTLDPSLEEKFTKQELTIYQSMLQKNRLKTSSVGRLFDAVASLLNICDYNSYEGEAAILLENRIGHYSIENCKSFLQKAKFDQPPTQKIIEEVYRAVQNGDKTENIILNFFYTLADVVFTIADKNRVKNIALSGGVFQNGILVDMLLALGKKKYNLYFNKDLSSNDENISFGQMMYFIQNIDSDS